MSFSKCLDIVNSLSQEDQDSVLSKLDQYQKMGMPAERAQVAAVTDVLNEIKNEKTEFLGMVSEQHPEKEVAQESQNDDAQDMQHSQRQPFYSALSKEVVVLNIKASPAQGWKDAIKGLVNKGLIKQDEVEWTGLNDWLDLQQGKVTKEQVSQYLDANGVQVQETVLGGEKSWVVRDSDGNIKNAYDNEADAQTLADDLGDAHDEYFSVSYEHDQAAKYEQYTLDGGENYREVLLTLPTDEKIPQRKQWQLIDVQTGEAIAVRSVAPSQNWLDRAASGDYRIEERMVNDDQAADRVGIKAYRSTHWDQPNVLAHLRVNDRTDAEGSRVLFVEEIQSDAGQDKRKGKTNWNAPFIGDTTGWLNLALKRVITMAVEGGYDKVAFVNGEQSADRYSLAKKIDYVEYDKTGNDEYYIRLTDHRGGRPMTEYKQSAAELEEKIGKDLTMQIIRGDGSLDKESGNKTIKAKDFVVGGEGMKKFYDSIVPNAVSALLKKVGGGKLETVSMSHDPNIALDQWESEDGTSDGSKAAIHKYNQPGFTITDTMREKAAGGLPLFSQRVVALAMAEAAKVQERISTADDFSINPITGDVLYAPLSTKILDWIDPQTGERISLDSGDATHESGDGVGEDRSGSPVKRDRPSNESGEIGIRRGIRGSQDNGSKRTGDRVQVGNGAEVQGTVVSDKKLGSYLSSVGGGFSSHSVGVQTFKRSLITKQAIENGELTGIPVSGLLNSKREIVGQTKRQYTPEQLAAFRNIGFEVEVPSIKERIQALFKDSGKKMAQGLADQFAPIKDISKDAYWLMRLSKGAAGAFETLMRGGTLKLTDNVYDFKDRGGVLDKLLKPMEGEHHDFLRWVAANRAERLGSIDKEHLFEQSDITHIKSLQDGDLDFDYTLKNGPNAGQTTRLRKDMYEDSLVTFNEFNKNVLDMAEESGLIDGSSRHIWESEFYVPFYRVTEDGDFSGISQKGGLVRQQAFKPLKGGTNKLNADLLDNTLMNWAHLIDASAKNRAAKASLEAAEATGVAIESTESAARQIANSIGKKDAVVWFMDNGVKRFFAVDDPYVFDAITSLQFAGLKGPMMDAMSAAKRMLTIGVTTSPFFKVRNLIRDSIQVIGTGPISYNPYTNIKQGIPLTSEKSDIYFRMLAGGATIHFGSMHEGNEAKRIQNLVEAGMDPTHLLDSDVKYKMFYRKVIEPMVNAYNELGEKSEMVNRAALYKQLISQNKSHAEASFLARDLMDFSMQGTWQTVRFLTQVVPFMNARIQGMYKLGKAAKEDPKRMAYVTAAVAFASLALLAAYSDDDDWKKREDWDRDNYWWFKIGGMAYRIPKPFELGSIGTLAERSAELLFTKEMTGTHFRDELLSLLSNNLSMNPIPQVVKPIMDVYSNKDSFSGRPIETMGMERQKSDYRFTANTSMAARAIGTSTNAVAEMFGGSGMSPVQVDHLIKGYFGGLGVMAVTSADWFARPMTGQIERPSQDIARTLSGGMLGSLDDAQSKYVSQVYQQAKAIEEAHGTWQALQKEGHTEEAAKFKADNAEKLAAYKNVEAVKGAIAKINQQIRRVEQSPITPDQKQIEIRRLRNLQDQFSRRLRTA